jgi:glycosyltransferase involved in cell wall biosynthesis
VDDGSTDDSTRIALWYAEQHPEKVRYLEHPGHENRGMSASRNLGITHAKGEYIALLDSDDVWLPHKLQEQVTILNSHPEASMVYGLSEYWHSWTGDPEDGQRDFVPELGIQANKLYEPPTLMTLLYPIGLGRATPPCPSDLMLRREMADRVGGFEESFKGIYQLYEDQAFLAKVWLGEPVFVASECWDRYRQHSEQCVSVVHRAGHYYSVRLFFLSWLAGYLYEQEVENTEIWKLLQDAQFQAHSKRLKKLERTLEKERRKVRRLERRIRDMDRQAQNLNRRAQNGLKDRVWESFKWLERARTKVLRK